MIIQIILRAANRLLSSAAWKLHCNSTQKKRLQCLYQTKHWLWLQRHNVVKYKHLTRRTKRQKSRKNCKLMRKQLQSCWNNRLKRSNVNMICFRSYIRIINCVFNVIYFPTNKSMSLNVIKPLCVNVNAPLETYISKQVLSVSSRCLNPANEVTKQTKRGYMMSLASLANHLMLPADFRKHVVFKVREVGWK